MTKTVYNPSCLQYCSELCGSGSAGCKGLCNVKHTECNRGILPNAFAMCPASARKADLLKLDFITYESNEVETFGKGVAYKRVEKIATNYSFQEFLAQLRTEFARYGEHTLSYWFLRATKIEHFAPTQDRVNIATITADFGEAIQIVAKNETSDQFFHRPEVQKKCL